MRRVASFSFAVLSALALFAPRAGAATFGGNLSWGDCGASGRMQEDFACDTNVGASVLYVSVVTGIDMPQLNGAACALNLKTAQASTLSPWWHMETDGCRGAASGNYTIAGLVTDFDFTGNTNCLDPWTGGAAGGLDYTPAYPFYPGGNIVRIRTVCAIPGSVAIDGTHEYYVTKLVFRHLKTVGEGACPGCDESACIALNTVLVTQPAGVGDVYFGDGQAYQRNWVHWQTGVVTGGCPASIPVRNVSWGQVKSLYR